MSSATRAGRHVDAEALVQMPPHAREYGSSARPRISGSENGGSSSGTYRPPPGRDALHDGVGERVALGVEAARVAIADLVVHAR